MIAQLEYGRYSNEEISAARVLQESTARQMQDTPYPIDPRLRRMTYAFADVTDNGVWTLGHQGYFPPMGSQMLLLPDQRLGIFFAVNTRDIGPLTIQHAGFQRAFFDHYFPAPAAEHIEPPADFAGRADRYVGLYRRTSYPPSTRQSRRPLRCIHLHGQRSRRWHAHRVHGRLRAALSTSAR